MPPSRPTLLALLAGLASLFLLAVAAAAQPQAHYRTGADSVLLPDSAATPGATRQVTGADLYPVAHTKLVRHVTAAQKHRAYAPSTAPRRSRASAARSTT